MATRVYVGNRFGTVIDEVTPDVGPVSWRLNNIGKTTLTFAKTDSKATERNLQYGNRVLIQFDSDLGLPDWGGVIDPPEVWSESNIQVSCYTIEYLLQFRQTDKTRAFDSDVVGKIFAKLIEEVQYSQDLGISLGRIWTGGRGHSPRYHFKDLWWIISESLRKIEDCDVRFKPLLSGGEISFEAQLYEKLGSNKSSQYALWEGTNVARVRYTKQGTIINEFTAVGSGSTWGDERATSIFYDRTSDQSYGLRQSNKIYSDVTQQTTLDRYAETEVSTNAQPHVRLELEVTNTQPAKFVYYDIGDVLRCVLPNYGFGGFDGSVRILSREFDPGSGRCSLVVEEETSVSPVFTGAGGEFINE